MISNGEWRYRQLGDRAQGRVLAQAGWLEAGRRSRDDGDGLALMRRCTGVPAPLNTERTQAKLFN